ncbi:MAG TPA: hypothetical protein VLA56_09270 [Pseudomonadales bacterium]|nr:hypothetical protein [Pseudomonadales bacterium]
MSKRTTGPHREAGRNSGSITGEHAARRRRSGAHGGGGHGEGAGLVDGREVRIALDLLSAVPDLTSMLWLPCRDADLYRRVERRLPPRVFLADYRAGRLHRVVDGLPESARGVCRARALDVPVLDWADGMVDVVWAPGILSRLAVPADRRLFLQRLAFITRRVLCVSARVSAPRRSSSTGFSGLGPEQAVAEELLLTDFDDVGLEVVERRRVLGPFSDRRVYLLGPADDATLRDQ